MSSLAGDVTVGCSLSAERFSDNAGDSGMADSPMQMDKVKESATGNQNVVPPEEVEGRTEHRC